MSACVSAASQDMWSNCTVAARDRTLIASVAQLEEDVMERHGLGAVGLVVSVASAVAIQFDRSCQDCVPDGSCSAPPCGVGVDNCGNGCARMDGCGGGSGYGGSTYGS